MSFAGDRAYLEDVVERTEDLPAPEFSVELAVKVLIRHVLELERRVREPMGAWMEEW